MTGARCGSTVEPDSSKTVTAYMARVATPIHCPKLKSTAMMPKGTRNSRSPSSLNSSYLMATCTTCTSCPA